jgi:predicted nucleotidyltransferase
MAPGIINSVHTGYNETTMDCTEISSVIRSRERDLRTRYWVQSLRLFGSIARGEATETSDVDVLVEFSRPVGLIQFAALKLFLEEILGRPVDLATPDALHPELREQILSEAVDAA